MRSGTGGLALTAWTAGVLLLLNVGTMADPQARELPTLRDVQFWDKPAVHSRNEQCPQGEDTVTFEKTVAMKPGSRRLSPMFAPREDFRSRGAVTLDCLRRCQASPRCLGVVVNYEHNACFAATAMDDEDVANALGSADQSPLVPASDRSNYFAKMCVHGPACDKDWVMERVPDKELRGFDDRVVSGVPTCQRCQELCLHEASFPCRSGEFDARARECRLSSQDRRSQPGAFGPAQGPHVHYFENLCLPASSAGLSCDFELHKDVDLRRPDQVRSAFSADQCRSLCETSREFACRSYSFAAASGICAMSGDDTVSLGGFALRMTPGVTVQFCLHECAPATCGSGAARSFGKRRRRRRMYFRPLGLQRRMGRRSAASTVTPPRTASNATAATGTTGKTSKSAASKKNILPTMLPEYPLQREIIVQGIGEGSTDSGIFSRRDRSEFLLAARRGPG
ncbi:hypothetical protein V5799_031894 [Amblyomma americanum]|uniref:Apple domain-containing protein n=1 Tax=Amblyomma americanum TaxID=6943 RepID=A0AAQ4DSQ8_AMBAM